MDCMYNYISHIYPFKNNTILFGQKIIFCTLPRETTVFLQPHASRSFTKSHVIFFHGFRGQLLGVISTCRHWFSFVFMFPLPDLSQNLIRLLIDFFGNFWIRVYVFLLLDYDPPLTHWMSQIISFAWNQLPLAMFGIMLPSVQLTVWR